MLVVVLGPAAGTTPGAGAAVGPCARSVFGDREPETPSADDPASVELGIRLRTRRAVEVLGVRFFKGVGNTGPHTGRVWSATGELLRAAPSSETAHGWQEALFETPVAIPEGTTFVASYHAPNGRYAYRHGALADGFDQGGPVYAPPPDEQGPTSLYTYGESGGFPIATFRDTNYFVDVLVDPGRPAPPGDLTSPAKSARAVLLRWSESARDDVAEYVVTRDGTTVGVVPSGTTSYTDRTVSPATTYTYQLQARGPCGALSEAAGPVVVTTPAEPQHIFGARTPSSGVVGDERPVEVGVKFQANRAGVVNGVRFYRYAAIPSGYVANLWAADGTLLASGRTVEGQGPVPGYQEVRFATPVPIRPGTTYVASYFASSGGYAFDAGGLSGPVRNGDLAALADESAGGNGVYRYGAESAFPTQTFSAANYWVDVTFTPST